MFKIMLVDDHKLIRQGLRSLLKNETDLEVVGEAENGHDAVQRIGELNPDVIVMDLRMPELNGVDATRQIREARNDLKIVCLSAHADGRMIAEMLKAGAKGYVLKDSAFEELVIAIRSVMTGKVYLSPAVTGLVVEQYVRGGKAESSSVFSSLSSREREVLQRLAEGESAKRIAVSLHVSTKTIETHRRNLMEKLNINNVADLTRLAIREGLSPL